ncbi:DUF4314 domain-containing protein [uncultured Photobacterium sp.]|uniref:DUF4314 domain-containing protein n=1 Tax=uncultured Photobacterium sp. TaxID=173973 RepID=UPI0026070C5D|nr:DUF4314 domain-containing protein [uncultured Photobacterium sp.]
MLLLNENLAHSAMATYQSAITRFTFARRKRDLLVAKSAAKWFNSARELDGLNGFLLSKQGLFVQPVEADRKVLRRYGYQNLWIKGTSICPQLSSHDIKRMYQKGTVIKLLKMDDEYPVPLGEIGKVTYVDDLGTIHTNWADGRQLGVCLNDGDKVEVVHYAH